MHSTLTKEQAPVQSHETRKQAVSYLLDRCSIAIFDFNNGECTARTNFSANPDSHNKAILAQKSDTSFQITHFQTVAGMDLREVFTYNREANLVGYTSVYADPRKLTADSLDNFRQTSAAELALSTMKGDKLIATFVKAKLAEEQADMLRNHGMPQLA